MTGMVLTALASVVVGAVVGVIAGLLGVGGGTVLLPIFRLAFGLSPVECTATSLFTIIPTSISGAASHMHNKTCIPKLGVVMGIGGACTSWIGVHLAQLSPGWMVMIAAALAIGYSAVTMFRKAFSVSKKDADASAKPHGTDASPEADAFDLGPRRIAGAVGIGVLAGLASGYIGLGGGFLMVPLMLALLDMPMKLTSGTSLIAIMILALPATVAQCLLGNVDYLVGIAVACGSIPGALVGAKLTKRVSERSLRLAFACLLLVGAVMLVVKEAGLLG